MLEWNVIKYNINDKKLVKFNIFDHSRFYEDLKKLLEQHKEKDQFAEELKKDLMYYFWCKAEYEVLISGLFSKNPNETEKIDIYDQIALNYDRFVNYIWDNKKEVK